jgi:transposase-like protein
MKRSYHVVEHGSKGAAEKMEAFCQANGQLLLPLVELVEQARLAVDTVLDQASRGVMQTILLLSAEQVAGPKTPGKASGEVRWHGRQGGRVKLRDRQLAVKRPRLRRKGGVGRQEVPIPAYEALRNSEQIGARMFATLLRGVSTRQYQDVIPEMAETVGVSKSSISREAIEAGTRQLEELVARRWDQIELLVIYIDGMQFSDHHVIGAVGVDVAGYKHVLGVQLGATENAAAVKDLLTHLRDSGLSTERQYLFVIDGSKALRAAIREVFGTEQPVQRCRTHKIRNVLEHLPKDELRQQLQVRSMLRAAWRCASAKEGIARMNQIAAMLDTHWPEAAASLREGLEETFTVNRLDVPISLHRCLVTTNVIESPQSGVRKRTSNVCRWRDGNMILRWVAGAWLMTEKRFRRIMGHQDLWALAGIRRCPTRSGKLRRRFTRFS